MSELRRDPIVGRWVIINNDDPVKPQDYDFEAVQLSSGKDICNCPFCYGNEHFTPIEIFAVRTNNTASNSIGWQVRVVPNKFPALQIEGDLEKRGFGLFDVSNGIGAHEVIIETPYHFKDFSDLTQEEIVNIIHAYAMRCLDLERDKRLKYMMIFKNYGAAAGASIEHPHTQLIALPMTPKNVKEELIGAQKYYHFHERCIFCDMIRQELHEKDRIVLETKNFIAFCPYASRFPFETWILPKKHASFFCQTALADMPEIAYLLKELITKMKKVFGNPAYNFMIHTSPSNGDNTVFDSYHWHIEFMPKLTRVAGFEWGTGFYVTGTSPEMAASILKEAK